MAALDRLFRPRSIAVVGGGIWGRAVIQQCRAAGFRGTIWPVHPKAETVEGLQAYTSIDALPTAPDATFIGVNRKATVDVVAALAARGAGGAVCFASGFREAEGETGDGASLQDALLGAAGEMPIIGPNCYGFLNYLDGVALWPDQHGGAGCDSGVAIVSQSSNISINLTMQRRGLPLAYMVTVGNQAQLGLAQIGMALLDDPRVTTLGLHIEGIGDLRAFEALAAHAQALGKPIVALKVGRSDQAQVAAVSHTASIAGSDAGARALLARLGIGQVDGLAELIEALKLLHVHGPLAGQAIASMSCSGGEASLIADHLHGSSLKLPPLNTRQKTRLRAALGPMVALANPLDYHTYIWGDRAAMAQTFTAMVDPAHAMAVVVLDFPRLDRCTAREWDVVIDAIADTAAATGVPMGVLASLPENLPEATCAKLIARGIAPMSGMAEAVRAMDVAAGLGAPVAAPLHLAPAPRSPRLLPEAAAKAELARCGLRVPGAARATTPEQAAAKASAMGFPVVLKGEGIAHKTEAGAVMLNLQTPEAVARAARDMPCDSYLVEELVTGTVAELLVGVLRDPAHGYVLTLAAGGTLTELLQDATQLLVPADRDALRAALGKLRIARLLDGYRGAPPAGIDAILDALEAVQHYVQTHPVDEVEINPLLCTPQGAIAADALVRIGDCDD